MAPPPHWRLTARALWALPGVHGPCFRSPLPPDLVLDIEETGHVLQFWVLTCGALTQVMLTLQALPHMLLK